MIPFLDLKAVNAPFEAEIEAALLRVARSGRYILGPEVEAFEAEWAAYVGARHCVGVGNGLDALTLMLLANGTGPGDEVIVASNTYIATWLAVHRVGARVVPVDPDLLTHNVTPEAVREAITPRTAAILATHLYGLPCDIEGLKKLGEQAGVAVFFDAAQAHGAVLPRGATAQGWSFYPTKNLGALGDAGAVTTDDAHFAARVRRLRSYGGSGEVGKYDHRLKGVNSRLDELQAAVLCAKLPHLDSLVAERKRRAGRYYDNLRDETDLDYPQRTRGNAWHQYVIRCRDRAEMQARLAARGVRTEVHYPVPPHLSHAFGEGFLRGQFPVAEKLAAEVLSLPMWSDGAVHHACCALLKCSAEPAHA